MFITDRNRLHAGGINRQAAGITAGFLALSMTLAMTAGPAIAANTVVEKKVVTTSDGATTTTSTTTTVRGPASETVVIAGIPVEMSAVWNTLENRRLELDRVISRSVSRGAMTPARAIALRSDLDKIAADLYAAMDAHSLSLTGATSIAQRLDALSVRTCTACNVGPFTKLVIVDSDTGLTRLVNGVFGEVVPVTSVDEAVFLETLHKRSALLRKLLASGEASGALTSWQCDEFRRELDRLSSLEKDIKGRGRMSYAAVLPVALQYDALTARMGHLMDVYEVMPLVRDSRMVLVGNRVVLFDDLMRRRAGLEEKVSTALADGSISNHDAARIRERLDETAALESSLRSDGKVSFDESRRLYKEFDKIGSSLDGDIKG